MIRRDADPSAGGEQHVGSRLPPQLLLCRDTAVDTHIDEACEPSSLDEHRRVHALGDDGASKSRVVREFEVQTSAEERPDRFLVETASQSPRLAIREAPDRLCSGLVVRPSLRQADSSTSEELTDRALARPAVDEPRVVVLQAELRERFAHSLGPRRKERVEGLLPRLAMELRAGDEHAVEVEHTARRSSGQPQETHRFPRCGNEPHQQRSRAPLAGQRSEFSHRLRPLVAKPARPCPEFARREVTVLPCRTQRPFCCEERKPPVTYQRREIDAAGHLHTEIVAPHEGSAACATASTLTQRGPVAQSVEQGTFNPKVVGSIPTRPIERRVAVWETRTPIGERADGA